MVEVHFEYFNILITLCMSYRKSRNATNKKTIEVRMPSWIVMLICMITQTWSIPLQCFVQQNSTNCNIILCPLWNEICIKQLYKTVYDFLTAAQNIICQNNHSVYFVCFIYFVALLTWTNHTMATHYLLWCTYWIDQFYVLSWFWVTECWMVHLSICFNT